MSRLPQDVRLRAFRRQQEEAGQGRPNRRPAPPETPLQSQPRPSLSAAGGRDGVSPSPLAPSPSPLARPSLSRASQAGAPAANSSTADRHAAADTIKAALAGHASRKSTFSHMITCYCCGRQYGPSSIARHLSGCPAQRENNNRQVEEAYRSLPIGAGPQLPIPAADCSKAELDAYNAAAQNWFDKHQAQCRNDGCGRRFEPDRLPPHKKGCDTKDPEHRNGPWLKQGGPTPPGSAQQSSRSAVQPPPSRNNNNAPPPRNNNAAAAASPPPAAPAKFMSKEAQAQRAKIERMRAQRNSSG